MLDDPGRRPGKWKYQDQGGIWALFLIFGSIFALMGAAIARIPEYLLLWFWIIIGIVWVVNALGIVFWVWVIPMKKQLDAQEVCDDAKLFMEGPWVRDREESEPFFVGFKSFTEISLDFKGIKEKESIVELMRSSLWKIYEEYLRRDAESESFQARRKTSKEEKEFLDTLKKAYEELKKKKEMEPSLNPELPEEKPEEKEKEMDFDFYKPYLELNIDEITQEDIELLESLHFYWGPFHDVEHFQDYDVEMRSAIVITTKPAEIVLQTKPGKGFYNGWYVNVPLVETHTLVLNFITESMPILFIFFSENMTSAAIDVIEKMNSRVLAIIQLKVSEVWINHLRSRGEQARLALDAMEQRAKDFEERYAELLLQMTTDSLTYGAFLRDKEANQLREAKNKAEMRSKGLIAIIIIIIIVFIIFIMVIASSPVSMAPESGPELKILNFPQLII